MIEPKMETMLAIDHRVGLRGQIIACGPGRPLTDGSCAPMQVRVSDMVRIKAGNAIEGIFEGKRIWIAREQDLLGVEELK